MTRPQLLLFLVPGLTAASEAALNDFGIPFCTEQQQSAVNAAIGMMSTACRAQLADETSSTSVHDLCGCICEVSGANVSDGMHCNPPQRD
jgi:hypothetical protein